MFKYEGVFLENDKQSKRKAFGIWLDKLVKLMSLGNLNASPGKSSIILPFSVKPTNLFIEGSVLFMDKAT